MKTNRNARGITFIEVVVVVAIFLTLLALAVPNSLNFRSKAASSTIISSVVSDIKGQQIKAMTGDTEGRGVPDTYSIYIQSDSYVLFHGQNYSQLESTNFTIPIDSQYQLETLFPENKIVFAEGTGEVVNFNPSQNSITVRETATGTRKTIYFNKYGTVTSIN